MLNTIGAHIEIFVPIAETLPGNHTHFIVRQVVDKLRTLHHILQTILR